MAIIALYSGSYCDGEEVAGLVKKRMGYESLDESLLEEAERRYSVPPDKLLRAMEGPVPMLNRFTHEREKSAAHLRLVLAELLLKDNLILHGPAVHLVGPGITHALKACIIANYDYRVKKAMEVEGLSEREAQKKIRKDDEQRIEWTKFLFGKAAYDQTLYDMVVPMHDTSVSEAVDLICDNAASEPLRTTSGGQRAAEGAVLAARVNLAMIEAGHSTEVTAIDGAVTLMIDRDAVNMGQYREKLSKIASAVEGVSEVKTEISPRFHATSTNPWANVETPPKVLLVDDEKEFVHTLSERLQTRNFESSVVYDGEQALEFVNEDEPDVMVLDLMMPGIDGIEVLRRVKREHPLVEVIILTGHGSDREETVANELGAFAYLKKPVGIDLLSQTMKAAYEKVNQTKAELKEGSQPPDEEN